VVVRRGERAAVHVSFHGWSYDTDGRLVGDAALQGSVPGRVGQERLRVHEVRSLQLLRLYLGHRWVPKAPSFQSIWDLTQKVSVVFRELGREDCRCGVFGR